MANPVGPVEGKQFKGFVPSGGLTTFLEGQYVFPLEPLANHHDGLASVKGVGHQAEGQFGELLLEPLTQALEALEFTVLLLGLRVVHIHLLMHEGEERAGGANDGALEDIAVTSTARGELAALVEALAALFLNAAIDHQDIPVVKEPDPIKAAALQQVPEHQPRDLGYPFRVHATGVAGRVIRTGDGGLSLKAWILGSLAAQGAQVPSRFPRLPLFVEAVTRAFAGEKGGQDLPPEVGGRIEAQLLDARVGQAVEPVVEAGKSGAHDSHQSPSGQGRVDARKRLAARRFATWP
jgi:hypothetical protein